MTEEIDKISYSEKQVKAIFQRWGGNSNYVTAFDVLRANTNLSWCV